MDTTTTTPTPSLRKTGLFVNRNVALLWTGGTISVFGDVIFDTSLVGWISVFLAAHQPWALLVPTFAFGPIAGVLVDRWEKRRTILWIVADISEAANNWVKR